MSCEIPPEVLGYIELVEADTPRACPEQHAVVAMIRRVFETEDIHVDLEQLANYRRLEKYFPFELLPWELFCFALWNCTYRADGEPRFKTLFCLLGRGAGKDAFIAFDAFCSVSPYNPVKHYNVDICANNEDQSVQPIADMVEVLDGPAAKKLNRHYYHTKALVQGRKNLGVVKGRTNNPKGRDGLRSGKVIFNEEHQYENYDNITVFRTGQGKVAQPRVGKFTSNGYVSDGPLDDDIARSRRILFEGEPDDGYLPFVCVLPSIDMVHDPDNWAMANPSLPYRPSLQKEIADEYRDWLDKPDENPDFIVKRMGIRQTVAEVAVTDYQKVLATKAPLPELSGKPCTVGIDYAELSDWAAVNLHFRIGNQRYDINHAWVCAQSKTLARVKAPWRAWAEEGHVTVVEDVSIPPEAIANYIADAGKVYAIKALAMDNFRWPLLADALTKIGFDARDKSKVKLVRTSDIMQVEPVIQECFNRGWFTWGDNPALRWGVNNAKRVRSSRKIGVDTGNFFYAKIEAKSRKTDMWMALVASMVVEPKLGTGKPLAAPTLGAITFGR